jgi:hypothetical protein
MINKNITINTFEWFIEPYLTLHELFLSKQKYWPNVGPENKK